MLCVEIWLVFPVVVDGILHVRHLKLSQNSEESRGKEKKLFLWHSPRKFGTRILSSSIILISSCFLCNHFTQILERVPVFWGTYCSHVDGVAFSVKRLAW